MKVETRGKYPGVKLHLEPEECQVLIQYVKDEQAGFAVKDPIKNPANLSLKMGKKISQLLEENPDLLQPRTPEQVTAILIKEAEKSALQLKHIQSGGVLETLNKTALKEALDKYIK